jgi:shikimate kinase
LFLNSAIRNPHSAIDHNQIRKMTVRPDAPIFLIGYRCTGKSSAARELARRRGYEFDDIDDQIERQAGKSIAAIFTENGESVFRDLESRILRELCARQRTVIALGGGTLGREENRRAVRAAGPAVWLTASVDTIDRRMAGDPTSIHRRPNLTTEGGRAEIETLLAARTPHYRECATVEIDTEGKTTSEIVSEIATRLGL